MDEDRMSAGSDAALYGALSALASVVVLFGVIAIASPEKVIAVIESENGPKQISLQLKSDCTRKLERLIDGSSLHMNVGFDRHPVRHITCAPIDQTLTTGQ
jgi:hypothetical protein